jgi:hypothetical protein
VQVGYLWVARLGPPLKDEEVASGRLFARKGTE